MEIQSSEEMGGLGKNEQGKNWVGSMVEREGGVNQIRWEREMQSANRKKRVRREKWWVDMVYEDKSSAVPFCWTLPHQTIRGAYLLHTLLYCAIQCNILLLYTMLYYVYHVSHTKHLNSDGRRPQIWGKGSFPIVSLLGKHILPSTGQLNSRSQW